jgi:hypothetical protein
VQERAQAFASEHKLSPEQQTTLTSVLVGEQDEMRQTLRDARDNDSFDGVAREDRRDSRAQR